MTQTLVAVLFALAAALQPDVDTLLTAGTRALVEAMLSGRPGPMVATFDDEMKAAASAAQLTQAVTAMTAQAGAFRGVTDTRLPEGNGVRVVVLACDFANGPVDVTVAWNGQARVAGLDMRPATVVTEYTPPDHVTYARFTAAPVTVGTRADVQFTSYPALNHLFIAGTGPSTPAEYQTEGHGDAAVVGDIAAWVLAR